MTHHAKPTAAASPVVPFKSESFPSYVLQRVQTRASSSCCPTLQQQDRPPLSSVTTTDSTSALDRGSPSPSSSSSRLLQAAASPSGLSITSRSRTPQLTSPASVGSPSTRTRSFQRPSLSDQLKSVSQGAQDITSQLKTTYNLQHGGTASATSSSTGLELQATTIGMSVGKLECRFPCPVHFTGDHCSYLFQHPFEAKEVHMVMYYRDMTQVHVSLRDKSFHFRINHALEQFGEDYRPANPQHVV